MICLNFPHQSIVMACNEILGRNITVPFDSRGWAVTCGYNMEPPEQMCSGVFFSIYHMYASIK